MILQRIYGIVFAAALAILSVWVLVPQLLRPTLPAQLEWVTADPTTRQRAAWAAKLGWPRGDLWIDYAQLSNAAILEGPHDGAAHPAAGNDKLAEAAARLKPTDVRGWLLLSAAHRTQNNPQFEPELKTSYYVSPYSEKFFPFRIQLASQLPAEPDEELRSLIKYELRQWLVMHPLKKSPVTTAYGHATSIGRRLIDEVIRGISPQFLEELHTAYP